MRPPGDSGCGDRTLGRRSLLGALGLVAGGGLAPAAVARSTGGIDPGGPPPGSDDRVPVDLQLKLGPIPLDRRAPVPVALRPQEPLETDEVRRDSLRFGPPDVVDDDGGAAPVGGERGDDLVYRFPVTEMGLGIGDTRLKLVGRTLDGRAIVGTTGFSRSELDGLF